MAKCPGCSELLGGRCLSTSPSGQSKSRTLALTQSFANQTYVLSYLFLVPGTSMEEVSLPASRAAFLLASSSVSLRLSSMRLWSSSRLSASMSSPRSQISGFGWGLLPWGRLSESISRESLEMCCASTGFDGASVCRPFKLL